MLHVFAYNYVIKRKFNFQFHCHFCIDPLPNATYGALILSRNGASSTSYYYGVVRVYYNGWGNICDDYYYNSAEAHVICHQLGYTGASSYSRAGLVRCAIYLLHY